MSICLVPKPKKGFEAKILKFIALNGPSSMYRVGKEAKIPYPTVLRIVKALRNHQLIELVETGKRGAQIFEITKGGITYCFSFNILSPRELVKALTQRTSVGKILFKIPEISSDLEAFVSTFLFGALLSLHESWRIWENIIKDDPSVAKYIAEEPERMMKYESIKRTALDKPKRGIKYATPAFPLEPLEYAERLYRMMEVVLLFRYLPSLTEKGKRELSELLSSNEEYKRLRDIMVEWKDRLGEVSKVIQFFHIIIEKGLTEFEKLRRQD